MLADRLYKSVGSMCRCANELWAGIKKSSSTTERSICSISTGMVRRMQLPEVKEGFFFLVFCYNFAYKIYLLFPSGQNHWKSSL